MATETQKAPTLEQITEARARDQRHIADLCQQLDEAREERKDLYKQRKDLFNQLDELRGEISKRHLIAYTIVGQREKDGKKLWVRIGSAFRNRDGSINVQLDAVPVNGTLHIRQVAPTEDLVR